MALLGNMATFHDKLIHQRMVYEATAHGDQKDVMTLLTQKPQEFDIPNEFGISPVMIAASYGHEKIMDYLIDLGTEDNKQPLSALLCTICVAARPDVFFLVVVIFSSSSVLPSMQKVDN
jgi:ankyrin repeat protein